MEFGRICIGRVVRIDSRAWARGACRPANTGTFAFFSASATFQPSEAPEITALSFSSRASSSASRISTLLFGVQDHRLLPAGVRDECLEPDVGRGGNLAPLASLGHDRVVGERPLEQLLGLIEPLLATFARFGSAGSPTLPLA